jgi:glyoxylase-like metal-dependent hydrolase (beta-lactamase superfamily II)
MRNVGCVLHSGGGRSRRRVTQEDSSMSIRLNVFVSPYKPVVNDLPNWDTSRQATFPASSVSLITGDKEAVMVDALITNDEVRHLLDWVRSMNKTLTTVYVTHGHGDHFFGLNQVLAAYPDAKAVALPEVVPFAQNQVEPGFMALWNRLFPNQIPQTPLVPQPMEGDVINLEGHEIRPVMVGQSDTQPSSVVHVPDLDAVVGGDVAYNGIHCWLAQTDHDKRERWIDALDTIASLRPKVVVAGHKDPNARDDDPDAILSATKTYIRDFDKAVRQSRSPQALIDAMMRLHGERGNPWTLWTAADGVKEQLVAAV